MMCHDVSVSKNTEAPANPSVNRQNRLNPSVQLSKQKLSFSRLALLYSTRTASTRNRPEGETLTRYRSSNSSNASTSPSILRLLTPLILQGTLLNSECGLMDTLNGQQMLGSS